MHNIDILLVRIPASDVHWTYRRGGGIASQFLDVDMWGIFEQK